jgi:LPS O-antigen subunit length determinant protein (WzzB/FepE family)
MMFLKCLFSQVVLVAVVSAALAEEPVTTPSPAPAMSDVDKADIAHFKAVLSVSKLKAVQKTHAELEANGLVVDPELKEAVVQEALDLKEEIDKTQSDADMAVAHEDRGTSDTPQDAKQLVKDYLE